MPCVPDAHSGRQGAPSRNSTSHTVRNWVGRVLAGQSRPQHVRTVARPLPSKPLRVEYDSAIRRDGRGSVHRTRSTNLSIIRVLPEVPKYLWPRRLQPAKFPPNCRSTSDTHVRCIVFRMATKLRGPRYTRVRIRPLVYQCRVPIPWPSMAV